MNNMTQEEKAKAYDEAIEKFDVILNLNTVKKSGTIFADDVRKILPELKESEDERIRKELLAVIDDLILPDEQKERFVAWLEKQGVHANFRNKIQIGDKVTRNRDGMLVNLSQLNRVAKKDEKQGKQETLCDKCKKEQPSHSCQDITELGRCALEKQGEQKSIEPTDLKTWKPSEEQIIALRWVLNNIPYNKHKEEISGLLDQIKEL